MNRNFTGKDYGIYTHKNMLNLIKYLGLSKLISQPLVRTVLKILTSVGKDVGEWELSYQLVGVQSDKTTLEHNLAIFSGAIQQWKKMFRTTYI